MEIFGGCFPGRKGLADIKEWEKEDQANPSPSAAAKEAYPYTSTEKAAIDYILGLDDVKAILKDPKYAVQIEESGEFYSLTINEGIISILQFKIRKGDGEIMRWYPEVRSFLVVSGHGEERDSIEVQLSSSPTPSPTSSSTSYLKQIQYDKLLLNLKNYHLVSETRSDTNGTFKWEVDKKEPWSETPITISIRAIKKQDFRSMDSIQSYLADLSPDYKKMEICNNVTDDSGIIGLYSVTGDRLTNYTVCYSDACYLIESDYSMLDHDLFKKSRTADYEIYNETIACAKSFTAYVNRIISYKDNKIDYAITQGKDGQKYLAKLSHDDKNNQNRFTLKNDKGESLLALSAEGPLDIYEAIKILDLNMDGYADIRFLNQEGTMNSVYDLYIWDDAVKNFVEVKCEESLTYFEVRDGYLQTWEKESANSGVIKKFVWDKNTLIKQSEEPYHTD